MPSENARPPTSKQRPSGLLRYAGGVAPTTNATNENNDVKTASDNLRRQLASGTAAQQEVPLMSSSQASAAQSAPVPHVPLPVPADVVQTTSAEDVSAAIGFTWHTVFQVGPRHAPDGLVVTQAAGRRGAEAGMSPRSPYDSWVRVLVPLSTNLSFRLAFQDIEKSARVGRILELADGLAADAGYRHCQGGYVHSEDPNQLSVATASIDSLNLAGAGGDFVASKDLLLTAYVTRVGKTSMEVVCDVEQPDTGIVAHMYFTMVSLGRGGRPIKSPPVQAPSDIADGAALRATRRAESRQTAFESATRKSPPINTLQDAHSLWRRLRRRRPAGADGLLHAPIMQGERAMASSRLETTQFVWPNEMNVHGTLFGGSLARTAVEVAYMTTAQYLGSTAWARLEAVDDVFFLQPVPAGALVQYRGVIIFTDGPDMVVRVEVGMVQHGVHPATWEACCAFYTHFEWSPVVPRVVPQDYGELLLYLEGLRRYHAHRITKTYQASKSTMITDSKL